MTEDKDIGARLPDDLSQSLHSTEPSQMLLEDLAAVKGRGGADEDTSNGVTGPRRREHPAEARRDRSLRLAPDGEADQLKIGLCLESTVDAQIPQLRSGDRLPGHVGGGE